MKIARAFLILAALAAITTFCPAKEPKANSNVVRDGSTPDRAVIITGPLKQYVNKEWAWCAKHYPGCSMFPYNQAILIHRNGYVDSITITTAQGKQKTVYFDINGVEKR